MSQNVLVIYRQNLIKEDTMLSDTNVANLCSITDRKLNVAYDVTLDNHHSKHANSRITSTSKFENIGIDINHIIKIMGEMANIYAKL